jgi:hypothetical protein
MPVSGLVSYLGHVAMLVALAEGFALILMRQEKAMLHRLEETLPDQNGFSHQSRRGSS